MLKYNEWRPIGVCDDAPLGVQKAQMFTREDFLIVTTPGVNRENWRKNPEVMKVLRRYSIKLAKQSMKTSGMIQPTISSIRLMGAVMKLHVTPTLNKESKDGKLQLFQIKYRDKGSGKKKRLMILILIVLLVVLLLLCGLLGFAFYKKFQTKQYKEKTFRFSTETVSYCSNPANNSLYEGHLGEVSRILQLRVDSMYQRGQIARRLDCAESSSRLTSAEEGFLECFALIRQYGRLSLIPSASLRKVKSCRKEICRKNRSLKPAACFKN